MIEANTTASIEMRVIEPIGPGEPSVVSDWDSGLLDSFDICG
jgi:hypothetical protein